MAIIFHDDKKLFQILTKNTEYQIKINDIGIIQHAYYGKKVGNTDMSYQSLQMDRGFSGNPYECRTFRGVSLDTMPQEYTGSNVGDFRISALELQHENGSFSCDWRYVSHTIREGKYQLEGLPYVRGNNGALASDKEAMTLEIKLQDVVTGMEATLYYGAFEEKDVITRTVKLKNTGKENVTLYKVASMNIDFLYGKYDLIHFHGRHCMERQMERVPIKHDVITIGSKRGMSSHHNNPFVILVDKDTRENYGNAYGFMLMYSGNHKTEVEMDYIDNTRLVMGINDADFSWKLEPGKEFVAPEVIMTYSPNGLNQLSNQYHRIIRENVIDAKYFDCKRHVLINNWEATYFDFNAEKILKLTDEAKNIGIDMFVLDDGWFGKRDDDNAGLGDWIVNEEKLVGGLSYLAEEINKRGMKFGLWFEPEMINEDSNLYRTHPEWVIQDPDRKPMMSRNQMVLDMSRQDVQDYLFEAMSNVLSSANIEYVKWDFNRSVTNFYSNALPKDQQGELSHRFMLGTYSFLDRLLKKFPHLMIEGCAGGGGRFDAGMLFYCPQIWTSDDTDAIARLKIQSGTSFGYPVCTMGAHVSAVPNHQTKRVTSIKTRGVVAMSGTFGYELDLMKTTKEDQEIMKQQIKDFHKYDELIRHGEYFRLTDEEEEEYFTSWEFVSPDKKEALVNIVINNIQANVKFPFVHMCGLEEDACYQIEGTDQIFTGASLMYGGYVFQEILINPDIYVDEYPGMQLHIKRI